VIQERKQEGTQGVVEKQETTLSALQKEPMVQPDQGRVIVGICGFNILHVHYIVILLESNLNAEVYSFKYLGTIDAEMYLRK
jgi:uncharacterized membrane protein